MGVSVNCRESLMCKRAQQFECEDMVTAYHSIPIRTGNRKTQRNPGYRFGDAPASPPITTPFPILQRPRPAPPCPGLGRPQAVGRLSAPVVQMVDVRARSLRESKSGGPLGDMCKQKQREEPERERGIRQGVFLASNKVRSGVNPPMPYPMPDFPPDVLRPGRSQPGRWSHFQGGGESSGKQVGEEGGQRLEGGGGGQRHGDVEVVGQQVGT